MSGTIKALIACVIVVGQSAVGAAELVAATAELHWDTFTVSVITGPGAPTLGTVVPPTFDYASVDSTAGSESVLLPSGAGAAAMVSDGVVTGSATISPFDIDGLESLPAGSPSGSIIASSAVSDLAAGVELVEVETNRTILVSTDLSATVLFEIDYTLDTMIAAFSAPLAQAIARVTLGLATFPDGTTFTLNGNTASLETLNVGVDVAHSLGGTLSFLHTFGAGESIFLAANALTTVDNALPATVVPLPAPLLLLLTAMTVMVSSGRRVVPGQT